MRKTTLLLLSAVITFGFFMGYSLPASKVHVPVMVVQLSEEELIQTEVVNTTVLILSGTGHGSGVVVKQDKKRAYILTANHVVEGAKSLWGRQFIGNRLEFELLTVVATDIDNDLALLESAPKWIGVAQIITSDSDIKLYSKVLACGFPATATGPIDNMVTDGRISRLHDPICRPSGHTFTSVPMTFGNSGGGLFIKKDGHFVLAGIAQVIGLLKRHGQELYIMHISGFATGEQVLDFLSANIPDMK